MVAAERRQELKAWLDTEPSGSLEDVLNESRRMERLFLNEVGYRIEHRANEAIRHMPHATKEDKTAICHWVNALAAKLHLGVRCPNTNAAGLLTATPGDNPAAGRFEIRWMEENGRRRASFTSVSLPHVSFTARYHRERKNRLSHPPDDVGRA